MEEEQAIALLKAGDLAGLEELVARHQVEPFQAAYLIVGDRHVAEDITRECFLRTAEKIHQFKDGRPFRPWFLRIVTNDALKTALRQQKRLSLDEDEGASIDGTLLRDFNPGPDELVDTSETRKMVWRALQQLTPKQRTAVIMRYFLDMRNKEIADELDRPLSSVKWSLHAAKARLRALLSAEEDPRRPQPATKDRAECNEGGES